MFLPVEPILTRAPGKLILAGEYAVLYGHPAIVCAMDRYFEASLSVIGPIPKSTSSALTGDTPTSLTLQTKGFDCNDTEPPVSKAGSKSATCTYSSAILPSTSSVQCIDVDACGHLIEEKNSRLALFCHVFNALLDYHDPAGKFASVNWCLTLDSSALFDQGDKLGLGSSAAMTVALDRLLAHVFAASDDEVQIKPKPRETESEHWCRLHTVHSAAQGKQGSGVDIAASLFGGVIAFRNDRHLRCELERLAWPELLHVAYIWSGKSASTTQYIGALSQWRAQNEPAFTAFINELGTASRQLQRIFSDGRLRIASAALNSLRDFTEILYRFDRASELGIFASGHEQAYLSIVRNAHAVYKPCGAGGGDLGVVLSTDDTAMADALADLRTLGMRSVTMNISPRD